ncbi:UDP-glucose dehydrogenase family protein [Nitrosopumilus sp.]|uniref:UDP-glucose dehydrogenase family protein n=1 Tax=Nitrosopumilus sp. TaxID=2024843 RepID=UPI003D10C146
MKIGIVGLGFVGLSLTSVLASKGYDVVGIDTDKEKCKKINDFKIPFFEPDLEKTLKNGFRKKLTITDNFISLKDCDIIFITVGTPQKSNGEIQLSMIKNATQEIGKIIKNSKKTPIIFLKSTVIPGVAQNTVSRILEKFSGKKAGREFGLVSNPEFLQETTAIRDTKFPHVVILGGNRTKFMDKAKKFLSKLHPGVPIIVTNHQTAEIIKYANNSFLATKISFINQLSNICQNIPGANVDDVASAIGLDPRIGKLFLNAGPGYGGSCLPKDVKAIMNFSSKAGVSPTFLSAVEKINQQQIENILKIIKNTCGSIKNKKITVLGLAFKPHTDDIRDSISLKIIKELLKNQAKITVHDPMAIENTRTKFKDKITYENSISLALKDSNCCIIMTAWPEYSKIQNKILKNMKNKIVIDSRRILKNSKLDCTYIALGIGK